MKSVKKPAKKSVKKRELGELVLTVSANTKNFRKECDELAARLDQLAKKAASIKLG